jgi:hypothetical protein
MKIPAGLVGKTGTDITERVRSRDLVLERSQTDSLALW